MCAQAKSKRISTRDQEISSYCKFTHQLKSPYLFQYLLMIRIKKSSKKSNFLTSPFIQFVYLFTCNEFESKFVSFIEIKIIQSIYFINIIYHFCYYSLLLLNRVIFWIFSKFISFSSTLNTLSCFFRCLLMDQTFKVWYLSWLPREYGQL